MWSLACMTFEMLTGELLFNPRKDNNDFRHTLQMRFLMYGNQA